MNATAEIQELDAGEARALFDAEVRRCFHMSGDEFIRKYEAGEFGDDDECPDVMRVAMLIPFGG